MYQLYNRTTATTRQLENIHHVLSSFPRPLHSIHDFSGSLQGLQAPVSALLSQCLVIIFIVGLVSGLHECYQYARVLLLRRKLPPGPFPLPILGNCLDIPENQPEKSYEEWSRSYRSSLYVPFTVLSESLRGAIASCGYVSMYAD